MLISSQKLSFALGDLYKEIQKTGWEVNKCKYDSKTDRFIASAKDSNGQEIEAFGANERYALTNLLHRAVTKSSSVHIAHWKTTFESQLQEIAEAYAKAPSYERKGAIAFVELGHECAARAKVIKQQINILITNNPDPYKTPDKMYDDVRKRRQLEVSRVGADQHPIWSREQVINFRICIDILGYTATNSQFDWEGTNHAFAAFAALLPELAQDALFTETVAQTAYATFYKAYGPAKVCLLTKFIEEAQKEENPHKGYRGIHPSQMFLPTEHAKAKFSKIKSKDDGSLPNDINDGWHSEHEGRPMINYSLDYPDFLGIRDAGDKLEKLHTDWADEIHDHGDESGVREEWRAYKQDDHEGAIDIQHAVGNAVKSAILMQDHNVGHAGIQYQDLLNQFSSDPEDHWKNLHTARSEWNSQRFGEHTAEEHRPWMITNPKTRTIPALDLANCLYEKDSKSPVEASKASERQIHQMLTRIHTKIKANDDHDEPKDERGWNTENEAHKQLMKWLDVVLCGGKFDHWMPRSSAVSPTIEPHKYDKSYAKYNNHKVFNLQRYPAVYGDHMQLISKLFKHLDQITEEALVDIHNHDGKGYHFRTYIASLEEIDPKTIGLMWLLLAPYTSQLSMIDEDMRGALGHHAKGPAARDYLLHERQLMAHKDAMGLEHIPLGHFNYAVHGTNNPVHQSTKEAVHQDLSALKVKNPTPAWKVPILPYNDVTYKFDLTKGADKNTIDAWNKSVATQFAPDSIPVVPQRPFVQFSSAWEVTPIKNKMQRLHELGMTVEDAWNMDEPLTYMAAQTGWTDWYHATPRANRESIQNLGLSGADGQSPWGDPWKREQPEGNYFFTNPEDAVSYAENTNRDDQPDTDWEDRYQQPEPPAESTDWNNEQWEHWYENTPYEETNDDPHGWDVWKVDTRGLPVERDPENQILYNRTHRNPLDVGQAFNHQKWLIQPNWEDQLQDSVDEYGDAPARYYTQEHLNPNRLQLHQHIPRWHMNPLEDANYNEDNQHPMIWDNALERRPTFPAHSMVNQLNKTLKYEK